MIGDEDHLGSLVTVGIAVLWALLWAAAFIVGKIALRSASAAVVLSARCLLAGVLCLTAAYLRGARRLHWGELGRLGVLGLLYDTGYLGLMMTALPKVAPGLASMLSACTPLLALGVLTLSGRERLGAVRSLGLVLGFVGVAVASIDRLSQASAALAIVLNAVGVVALTAATLLTPRLARGVDVCAATGWESIIGVLPLVALAAVGPTPRINMSLVVSVVFLAVAVSGLDMMLWLVLIRRVGAGRAAIAQFMPPLFTIAMAALCLGEAVTPLEAIAIVPIALGVALATRTSTMRGIHGHRRQGRNLGGSASRVGDHD